MERKVPFKTLHGFSLIEMIIVIMVISIVGGSFALITYQPYPIELTATANQLASDLRYTQSLSMTKGARYRLQSVSGNQYQIINETTGTPVMLALGSTTVTMGGGITFGTATNIPNSLIAYDGWGAPYVDTANTALTATATIILQVGTQTQTVTILPVTGRVTVP